MEVFNHEVHNTDERSKTCLLYTSIMTTQEIIEVIKGLSVLELNDLVKACEEEFGVSAAAGDVYKRQDSNY